MQVLMVSVQFGHILKKKILPGLPSSPHSSSFCYVKMPESYRRAFPPQRKEKEAEPIQQHHFRRLWAATIK